MNAGPDLRRLEGNVANVRMVRDRLAHLATAIVGRETEPGFARAFLETWTALDKAVGMLDAGATMRCPNCGALNDCSLCGAPAPMGG